MSHDAWRLGGSIGWGEEIKIKYLHSPSSTFPLWRRSSRTYVDTYALKAEGGERMFTDNATVAQARLQVFPAETPVFRQTTAHRPDSPDLRHILGRLNLPRIFMLSSSQPFPTPQRTVLEDEPSRRQEPERKFQQTRQVLTGK